MIPLYSAAQLKELDRHTIATEPIASLDLMERAAEALFQHIKTEFPTQNSFAVFCGPGNNGGDGLALSRLLLAQGAAVQVFILPAKTYSADFEAMKNRLNFLPISLESDVELKLDKNTLIVDALFGYGLDRPLSGLAKEVVESINALDQVKLAIDMPSGMQVDQYSLVEDAAIVKADYCLSFEFPKLNFLLPEHGQYVGKWTCLSIGILPLKLPVKHFYFGLADAQSILKPRGAFTHKGSFGHGVLLAGSTGKMGAGILAARAAMRSGMGLLSVQVSKANLQLMQLGLPEAMCLLDEGENQLENFLDYSRYSALAIGPGIGLSEDTERLLKRILQDARIPLVLDADALNLLSQNKTWYSFVPKESILTPHPGEFRRLVGDWETDQERLELQMEFALKYGVYLILKGKNTSIACPDGTVFFNATGNSGMATGGSGDTLTGILLGFLAQGYAPEQAALLGVFIHGYAGDLAAEALSEEALIASDLSEYLPKAFRVLQA